ncbi:hypothetical protein N7523_002808 [Penicillium sp. IBT 18751x]|nr:hypothetical protein N7523_002808 [Penicillium sp. IBT 18751x]
MVLGSPVPGAPRKRASKPKVRTGCFTCKTRRVKCDEAKPACARCTSTGRKCDGYPLSKSSLVPRALAPAPGLGSRIESRALEFFFHKTAPQLAGLFAGEFFQGSVLKVSLVEPAIRQAMAAIGIVHEQAVLGRPYNPGEQRKPKAQARRKYPVPLNVPIQLYNRSIRAIVEKVISEPNPLPLVAMINILFTCFEYFQGNTETAAAHIRSGIRLLQDYRETQGASVTPWGTNYGSFEARFMEMEIAPLLSVFNINVVPTGLKERTYLIMNPVDDCGRVILADRFDTLYEARVGLMDLITSTVYHFKRSESGIQHKHYTGSQKIPIFEYVQLNLHRWRSCFDDLIRRQEKSWNKTQRRAADMIRIISHSTDFSVKSSQVVGECDWDSNRAMFEELIELTESILSDRFTDESSRTLALDSGMLFHLHIVAWKCRWPHLRRQGLDLLTRSPRREWQFEAQHYHAIFTRIMEIEEAYLRLPKDQSPANNILPPEHVRIHNFTVATLPLQPEKLDESEDPVHAVNFWCKPWGLDGPWGLITEHLQLKSSQRGAAAVPVNLASSKPSDVHGSWRCSAEDMQSNALSINAEALEFSTGGYLG